MEVKHITFIIGGLGRGGAERVISNLANHYARRGKRVDVIMLLNDLIEYDMEESIRAIPLCNPQKSRIQMFPLWIRGIRNYIKEDKPQLLISFIARINIITIIAKMCLNVRLIVSERNDPRYDGQGILVKRLSDCLYVKADHIVFQSREIQSLYPKRIREKSSVILNPVHVMRLDESIEQKHRIITMGRLVRQKNHRLLIHAFENVADKNREYELYIYGEGSLREELEELVRNSRCADRIHLPGLTCNVEKELQSGEIFVLSSDFEGLSNALLEAMSAGLPCISTMCAGSREVIRNGVSGILVPIGNQEALEEAIQQLIDHKELRERLSQGALRESVRFTMENVVAEWDRLIHQNIVET